MPYSHYEDYGFWCRAFKAGYKFRYVPITVYEHTNRADSMLKQLHCHGRELTEIALRGLRENKS